MDNFMFNEKTFFQAMCRLGRSNDVSSVSKKVSSRPSSLFRYRQLTEAGCGNNDFLNRVLNEMTGNIWLQVKKYLNDPFDMKIVSNVKTYDELVSLFARYPAMFEAMLKETLLDGNEINQVLNSKNVPEAMREFLNAKLTPFQLSNFENFWDDIIRDELKPYDILMEQIRIACFTESNSNTPMWSHYTDGYRGVCFEYSLWDTPHRDYMFPVVYTDELPDFYEIVRELSAESGKAFGASIDDILSVFPVLLSYKNSDWRYEREWRYFNIGDDLKVSSDRVSDDVFEEIMLDGISPENLKKLEESNWVITQETADLMTFDKTVEAYKTLSPLGRGLELPKPSRIYLGHEIRSEDEEAIVEKAHQLDIEVFKMLITHSGYVPITPENYVSHQTKSVAEKFIEEASKHLKNDEYKDAIHKCNEAIIRQPRLIEAYRILGCCFLHTNALEESLKTFSQAQVIDSTNPTIHNGIGIVYHEMGNSKKAKESFMIAIKNYRRYRPAYINLALIFINEFAEDKAKDMLKKGNENGIGFADNILNLDENAVYNDVLRGDYDALRRLFCECED